MSHLIAKDYRRLLDVIDVIYSIKDRNALLQAVCERLEPLVPVSTAVFIGSDPNSGAFLADDSYGYRVKDTHADDFVSYYAPQDPLIWSGWLKTTRNKAGCYTDFIPARKFKETEYARDFLSRIPLLYSMCASLDSHGHSVGILGLHRQARDADFNVRDKEIFNRILPHLARALLDLHHPHPTMGVILLDENNCPAYMNDIAERVTHEQPIKELLAAAAVSQTVRTCGGGYSVNAVKLRNGKETIVFLSGLEDTLPLHWKLSAFCLTPRQQEIVRHVVQGLSNHEIAERLFISLQTVKDHLHDIYKKMQVTGRCDLMAKVLGS